jgi:hypothetical protein
MDLLLVVRVDPTLEGAQFKVAGSFRAGNQLLVQVVQLQCRSCTGANTSRHMTTSKPL